MLRVSCMLSHYHDVAGESEACLYSTREYLQGTVYPSPSVLFLSCHVVNACRFLNHSLVFINVYSFGSGMRLPGHS